MLFLTEHCKLIFLIILLIDIPLVAWYIRSLNKRKPYKVKKMVCSTLFVLAGALASLYGYFNSDFFIYPPGILIALVLSWLGDLFLAFSLKGKWFIFGLGSFLLAHVAYVVAFSLGVLKFMPSWYEYIIVAVMLIACFIIKNKCDIKLGEMKIPVLFYAITISVMLARAINIGITALLYASEYGLTTCILMIFGALMFVASDSVLVFIIFKNKSNSKTETANLVTYYLAQFAFAASIFFII